jgi:hypothetical protein
MSHWTTDNTALESWFERDRSYVALADASSGRGILEAWDADVQSLIEDGFLDPRDLHRSAVWYANHLGVSSTE